ncbi:hypothetical protein TVAG_180190 [Trichomonas vaginalis G3]|uniref:Uncharacterized protein n=1 Tax=Trichomonas vaginalis (strain ATCC PRA-98 / G3) TaxID=412133 RepID=A2EE48_TRIV3|nr:hypothetical protein TVAGG3_0614530 [Trichomonas vaginalis G3]EAY09045.1 hypothetical protein TVAG_180190 [Trichomonas vaginalis G3]KAI5503441.1 hypothetical protein TVAGG3_0614530 [Trichomonas vaginalis G3]|eukprot:XP_001321268.1 hypothetical protein [Trichomonas vaginalis G3]
MKGNYDQIRQIPKIAGTVEIKCTVNMTTAQNLPDKPLTPFEIADFINCYSPNQEVEERELPSDEEHQLEVKHWEQICNMEDQRISDAEKLYQQELDRLLRECPQKL